MGTTAQLVHIADVTDPQTLSLRPGTSNLEMPPSSTSSTSSITKGVKGPTKPGCIPCDCGDYDAIAVLSRVRLCDKTNHMSALPSARLSTLGDGSQRMGCRNGC